MEESACYDCLFGSSGRMHSGTHTKNDENFNTTHKAMTSYCFIIITAIDVSLSGDLNVFS